MDADEYYRKLGEEQRRQQEARIRQRKQRANGHKIYGNHLIKDRITSKPYFWFALGAPILLFILSLLMIVGDSETSLTLKYSLDSLNKLIETLKIPFSILGLTFVTVGSAFAYYRIELSYQQHERQLEQKVHSNYKDFRDEFFMLSNERNYEYKIIDIPNSWLFSSLYPNAKKGDQKLIKEFEELLGCDDGLYGFQCVLDAFNSDVKGARYTNSQYKSISNLFMWFREVFTFDAKLNMGFSSGLYKGDFAKYTFEFMSDFLHIISTVNAFEGWRFFDNKKRRTWLNRINSLETIAENAKKIDEYFSSESYKKTQLYWFRQEFEKITKEVVMGDFPTELQNDTHAKFYIFKSLTDKRHGGVDVPEEVKMDLASVFGINQFLS